MKIVLDTNILLVSISPNSRHHWILQKFIAEDFTLCVTSDILNEYEEIIGKHMGKDTANLVMQILENAINIEFVTKYFRWRLITTDSDDNKFVDCAISCNAKYLVTQDKHFNILKDIPFPKVAIINIDTFQEIFNQG